MTTKLKYLQTRTMEPREGVKYSTTYYQQNSEQAQAAFQHVRTVAEEIIRCGEADLELKAWIQTPLKAFPRTGIRPNYSVEDIVSDLLGQLDQGKDIPSGMLGRWNRLFEDTPWDIELEEYVSPRAVRQGLFNNIFEIKV
jgi:hypothetical protein